jgi:MOSC domain-containing protein
VRALQTETRAKQFRIPVVGSVAHLWRYPVKSMMGEELDSSDVTERGLLGDRAYALVDQVTGKIASAKNPRKWGKLFDFRAALVDAPRIGRKMPDVQITLPDGRLVTGGQSDADSLLSEVVGVKVKLMTSSMEKPSYEEYWPDIEGLARRETVTEEFMPPQTFFDAAVVHVLTTGTLDRLHELYPEGRFEPRRFRPNIVIAPATPVKQFVENDWVDRTLHLGSEVRLRVTGQCARCVMTTLPQGDLPQDLGILQTAARYNRVSVGVYASVVAGGNIKRGDDAWIE